MVIKFQTLMVLTTIFQTNCIYSDTLTDMALRLKTLKEARTEHQLKIKVAQYRLDALRESESSCKPCQLSNTLHGMQVSLATRGLIHTCSELEIILAKEHLRKLQDKDEILRKACSKELVQLVVNYMGIKNTQA